MKTLCRQKKEAGGEAGPTTGAKGGGSGVQITSANQKGDIAPREQIARRPSPFRDKGTGLATIHSQIFRRIMDDACICAGAYTSSKRSFARFGPIVRSVVAGSYLRSLYQKFYRCLR